MRILANFLLDPLLHIICVLVLSGLLYWRGLRRASLIAAGYCILVLIITAVSPLPGMLAEKREFRFRHLDVRGVPQTKNELTHILVLGAGHSNAPNYPVHDRLSEPALKRFLEGIRIKRALPNAKLVCSGYSSSGRQSQAAALAQLALELGVSPLDTLLQPQAVNTEAEAKQYSERFGTETQLILVTSALHMPRAMFWFKHFGQNPIPAPTNHLVMPDPGYESFAWKPSIKKIEMTQKLLHEYAGMLYAKLKTCNG